MLLTGVDEKRGSNIWERVGSELVRLDKMLNRFDPASEVSRVNRSAAETKVEVSNDFWTILKDCGKYHRLTNKLFDVTLSDFSKINFYPESRSVSFESSEISLDFGGYAKGYALEKIKTLLHQEGIQNALINFGNSSILGLGHHPYGDCWQVSIENPFKAGETLGVFELKNQALNTSGNTPIYAKHIINPLTRKFSSERKCICVITVNACDGEVLTTALFTADTHEKQKILSKFDVEKFKEYNL